MQPSILASIASQVNGIRSQNKALTGSRMDESQSTSGSGSSSSSSSGTTITSDDFLQLLVAEMKNQDPTANTDPNEYINQLVQVNSLQQLISINQDLTPSSSSTSSAAGSGSGSNGTSSASASASNVAIGGLASAMEANFENTALASTSTDGSNSSKHSDSFAAQHRLGYSTVSSNETIHASAAHVASALAPEGTTIGQGVFPLRSTSAVGQAGAIVRP